MENKPWQINLAIISLSEKENENSQTSEKHWLSKTWHYGTELALYAIFNNRLYDLQYNCEWHSHINIEREIFKRSVLVFILSNIVISDMETNIKIAADVQTVRTHIMIKKDEYNAITSV